MTFSLFRLVDTVISYQKKKHIITQTSIKDRKSLLCKYNLNSIIIEIAAQSCGLMSRIDTGLGKDCFLGKINYFTFKDSFHFPPDAVQTSSHWIENNRNLIRYKGQLRIVEGQIIADFELLICLREFTGENFEISYKYWQNYLNYLNIDYANN